jgi:hypothetical protein
MWVILSILWGIGALATLVLIVDNFINDKDNKDRIGKLDNPLLEALQIAGVTYVTWPYLLWGHFNE